MQNILKSLKNTSKSAAEKRSVAGVESTLTEEEQIHSDIKEKKLKNNPITNYFKKMISSYDFKDIQDTNKIIQNFCVSNTNSIKQDSDIDDVDGVDSGADKYKNEDIFGSFGSKSIDDLGGFSGDTGSKKFNDFKDNFVDWKNNNNNFNDEFDGGFKNKNNFNDKSKLNDTKNKTPFKVDFSGNGSFDNKYSAWDDDFLDSNSGSSLNEEFDDDVFNGPLNGGFNSGFTNKNDVNISGFNDGFISSDFVKKDRIDAGGLHSDDGFDGILNNKVSNTGSIGSVSANGNLTNKNDTNNSVFNDISGNFNKEQDKLNKNSTFKNDILGIDRLKSSETTFKTPNINFNAHNEFVAKRSVVDNQIVNTINTDINKSQHKQNILPTIDMGKDLISQIQEQQKTKQETIKQTSQEQTIQTVKEIQQQNAQDITNSENNSGIEYIYSSTLDFSSPIPPESFAGDGYQKIRSDRFAMLNTNATEQDLLELYKQNKDLESLDISNCDRIINFDIISKFENLKELNVNNCDNFNNIECLRGCENLRVLNIGNTKVRNIDNIGIFPELRILNCTCNSITNVDNIGKCEKLVELNLWGSVSVNSIDGIDSLYNLRLLDVDSTSIVDLFPTVNCKKLEFLFMDNCTKLMDIYALSSLSSLRCLLADGKNMFTDSQLEVFEDLTTLEYLTLNSRRVQTLHYFRKLIKMKELILQGCNITDLRPVEDMVDMKKIDLTANSMLKDINPLHKMKGLKKLILGGGGTAGGKVGSAKGMASSNMIIEDISVVENFNQLEEINLSSNIKLKDVSAMHVCEKMEEVDFSKCMQLEDVSVLGTLKNITKINVSSCPRIKELYFLRNLPELQELLYNGTIVSTPGLTTVLKKANGIYLLKGNDADIVSQAMLTSGKKKAKLTKAFKKYFSNKEDKK